jgi:orotidine-5'-phosphate decarboxylase
MNGMDRLYGVVAAKGNVCVGLDTCIESVPDGIRNIVPDPVKAILAYNKTVIDATFDAAACYKVQIAYYEALGLDGLAVYAKTLAYIRERGGISIADVKRGDIAATAERYATAHFSGDFEADFVTLNPYMGMDSLEPWLEMAEKKGKGAFVLMRTSNPGMRDFQYKELKTGEKLYNEVALALSALAAGHSGASGYGCFGAVVGCTERSNAAEIRAGYKNLFFLIPGYGAQGGGAADAVTLLSPEGNGGIVNVSRSILNAWRKADAQGAPSSGGAPPDDGADAARNAVLQIRDDIRALYHQR